MTTEEKVDKVYADIHEMKPMLSACLADLRAMEARQRFLETTTGKHEVQIARAITDLDSLGKNLRTQMDRARLRGDKDSGSGGKWIKFLELLVVLPQYWRLITLIVISLLSVIGLKINWHLKH